ncbi:toll/interleukin-1 receptor domain-containing protein [Fusibacter paucivorans]|uniref:Toll/interleukin-1 receptor domain-containing protein n=1 Tax=Fusibacter paucivorans TaxID=76009 RepID=A0ABS5PV21_9FIRM|nr:toll/interleukin-1 receptor domain-containing protein [Fusibacter paucivorans]MBS7528291.1 toll/interleukin-1 receptor domain-containing protein [Fusibacter paucivorans]
MKVFISHSSKNRKIVNELGHFISDLNPNVTLFCSSMEGHLNVGEDFLNKIINGLNNADVFIAILSEEYLASKFCVMELGAAWMKLFEAKNEDTNKYLFPLVLHPINTAVLNNTPIHTTQAIGLNTEGEIKLLVTKLIDIGVIDGDIELYLKQIEDFHQTISELIQQTNASNLVTRSKILNISSNGVPEALQVTKIGNDKEVNIAFNFDAVNENNEKPTFTSMVLKYRKPINLEAMIDNAQEEAFFQFKVKNAYQKIKKIKLEIKSGPRNEIILEHVNAIESLDQEIHVPFLSGDEYGWDEITEICFVIFPEYLEVRRGDFSISEINTFLE